MFHQIPAQACIRICTPLIELGTGFLHNLMDDKSVLALSLAAVVDRKARIDAQLKALRQTVVVLPHTKQQPRESTVSSEPIESLPLPPINVAHAGGYLAIDLARQDIISTVHSKNAVPAKFSIVPLQPPLLTGDSPAPPQVDPLQRARSLLDRSSAAQAESLHLLAARDALKTRVANESKEIDHHKEHLAATVTQLDSARAELVARTAEVELLRGQLGQLMGLTSELLCVVDPEWEDLVALRSPFDRATESPREGVSSVVGTVSASAFGGMMVRLDSWAARHDFSDASR